MKNIDGHTILVIIFEKYFYGFFSGYASGKGNPIKNSKTILVFSKKEQQTLHISCIPNNSFTVILPTKNAIVTNCLNKILTLKKSKVILI